MTSGSLLLFLVVTFPSVSTVLRVSAAEITVVSHTVLSPALYLFAKLIFVVLATLFLPAPVGSVLALLHSPFYVQRQP